MRGTLFLPPDSGSGKKFPLVLTIYGGIVRGRAIEERAAVLAAKGQCFALYSGFVYFLSEYELYIGRLSATRIMCHVFLKVNVATETINAAIRCIETTGTKELSLINSFISTSFLRLV